MNNHKHVEINDALRYILNGDSDFEGLEDDSDFENEEVFVNQREHAGIDDELNGNIDAPTVADYDDGADENDNDNGGDQNDDNHNGLGDSGDNDDDDTVTLSVLANTLSKQKKATIKTPQNRSWRKIELPDDETDTTFVELPAQPTPDTNKTSQMVKV